MVEEKKSKAEKKDQVSELKEQVAELEENWKRALADYKNLEKRVAEEKEAVVKLSNLVLISRLLPVLDNLEMLEDHVGDAGLKMIVKEFRHIFEDEGVEEVKADGKKFDPEVMEAVDVEEGSDRLGGDERELTVQEVVQKGYKLHGKLIRPARVKVGE